MYVGDASRSLQVGSRTIKHQDPWRAGVLCAFVPFYVVWWWWRTASELRAVRDATDNADVRISPMLVVLLVVLGPGLIPTIIAVVIWCHAVRAAQQASGIRQPVRPGLMALGYVAASALPAVVVLIAIALGASGGGLLAMVAVALAFGATFLLVFFEAMQRQINTLWVAH